MKILLILGDPLMAPNAATTTCVWPGRLLRARLVGMQQVTGVDRGEQMTLAQRGLPCRVVGHLALTSTLALASDEGSRNPIGQARARSESAQPSTASVRSIPFSPITENGESLGGNLTYVGILVVQQPAHHGYGLSVSRQPKEMAGVGPNLG